MTAQAKVNQPTAMPTVKVTSGGLAGMLMILLVWVAGEFGLEVPPEVASAATVLITAGVAYLVKERAAGRRER